MQAHSRVPRRGVGEPTKSDWSGRVEPNQQKIVKLLSALIAASCPADHEGQRTQGLPLAPVRGIHRPRTVNPATAAPSGSVAV